MNIFKNVVRSLLRANGRQISPYPDRDLMRRMKLIRHFRIDKILDVGANDGYYASQMIELGFRGPIISFEPIREVFQKLTKASSNYRNWQTENMALGDEDGEAEINVAGNNGGSSSILEMLPTHIEASPESRYVGRERIVVRKLDTIFSQFYEQGDRILMKLDTQGFERNVLEGALRSLKEIQGVQIEMFLQELYKGQMLFDETIRYMEGLGFRLYSIENAFYNKSTGQLLCLDGIFFRENNI